jgi:hypothetical protein
MTQQAWDSAAGPQAGFRLGDVLNRSLSVFGRNFLLYATITAVATSPTLITTLWIAGAAARRGPSPPDLTTALIMFGGGMLAIFLGAIAQAAVLFVAFQNMRSRPVSPGEVVGRVLARILPLVGTFFLIGLMAGLGLILLVFPFFMVLMMTYVAVPVCVIENLGPIDSIGRSRALTKGFRWLIFVLFLIVAVVGGIVNVTISQVGALMLGPVLAALVAFPFGSVVGSFASVLSIVVYHDLRVAKEGIDTDSIAAVFD